MSILSPVASSTGAKYASSNAWEISPPNVTAMASRPSSSPAGAVLTDASADGSSCGVVAAGSGSSSPPQAATSNKNAAIATIIVRRDHFGFLPVSRCFMCVFPLFGGCVQYHREPHAPVSSSNPSSVTITFSSCCTPPTRSLTSMLSTARTIPLLQLDLGIGRDVRQVDAETQ